MMRITAIRRPGIARELQRLIFSQDSQHQADNDVKMYENFVAVGGSYSSSNLLAQQLRARLRE